MTVRMITNPSMMETMILQVGERAMKGMAARMHRHAIRIRDLAREYAPVKTGLLESAIDYKVIKDGRRKGFVVFVDLGATKQVGKNQRVVRLGEYVFIMEQSLRPYGNRGKAIHLGPGSVKKASSGRKVGGHFLSRAVKQGTVDILGDMAIEVLKVTGGSGANFKRPNRG